MRLWITLLLAIVVALPAAYGQWIPPMKASVPFDFHFGDKAMPAGEYRLATGGIGGSVSATLWSVSDTRKAGILFGSLREDRKLKGDRFELVFYKYDSDHSFLRAVRSAATQSTYELPMCRTEREHVTSTFSPLKAEAVPEKIVVPAGKP